MNCMKFGLVLVVFTLAAFFPLGKAQADMITSLSVSVTPAGGGLDLFDYTLINSAQSTVSVYLFALPVDSSANLQSISMPTDWGVTYNTGDTSITWTASTDQDAIAPGSTAVFGFTSAEPPVVGSYQIVGFDPANFLFYENSGTIQVPGTVSIPEPSSFTLLGTGALLLLGCTWLRRCSPA